MEQFKRKEGGKKGKKKKRNTAQPLHGGCGCGAMRAASLLPVGSGGIVLAGGAEVCRGRFAGAHPTERASQGKAPSGRKIRQAWERCGEGVPINI